MNQIPETLSYDDVLLKPSYSDIIPDEIDVRVSLSDKINFNVPVLSAAMDTVTEADMAIALALEGAAGVIHSNLPPEDQAMQISRVKRFLNWIIDAPITVSPDSRVGDVRNLMREHKFSGFPVVENGKLIGIITSRDMRFCSDYSLSVREVMTPDPVREKQNPSIKSAQEKFDTYKIEKLPVVDAEERLIGLITVKDMERHQNFPKAALDSNGRLIVGAAVSPYDYQQRMPLLIERKVDFVVVDTAHGDSKNVLKAIEDIKKNYSIFIIGGNVATKAGTRHLIDAGCDAIKVGVGPGSICTTRVVAGIGVAQFSAVMECSEEAAKDNIPVIADGGIKYSGDITKAIAAGAQAVMIGNLFAGLKEAPGREILFEGRIFKEYRGMGSIGAMKYGSGSRYQVQNSSQPVPEGIEGRVPYKGELRPYLHQLVTGLKKGMGYCGCRTIDELRNYHDFVRITFAGLKESHAHDVAITQEAPNYSRRNSI
ncbi:MAG: IMP dehydrogenase [Spirochaetales bacterium]|nr:IMP dehydrogenase [Spirochaetales bacterium]